MLWWKVIPKVHEQRQLYLMLLLKRTQSWVGTEGEFLEKWEVSMVMIKYIVSNSHRTNKINKK